MKKNFARNTKSGDELFREIEEVCEGLVYISEKDAPVTAYRSDELVGKDESAPIEIVSFDRFFDRLTTEKDWFGDIQKQRAEKFRRLKGLLEVNLDELRVIRLGKIQVDIVVVGCDRDGRLMGIRTAAVET